MPRKAQIARAAGPDWFLVEWMRTLQVSQAQLMRETGWSKATTNDIYHGKTGYYRQIVNEAALALRIAPHELLMPPSEAMHLRRIREYSLAIAAEEPAGFTPAEPPQDRLVSGLAGRR